jgi:hypothetical protein
VLATTNELLEPLAVELAAAHAKKQANGPTPVWAVSVVSPNATVAVAGLVADRPYLTEHLKLVGFDLDFLGAGLREEGVLRRLQDRGPIAAVVVKASDPNRTLSCSIDIQNALWDSSRTTPVPIYQVLNTPLDPPRDALRDGLRVITLTPQKHILRLERLELEDLRQAAARRLYELSHESVGPRQSLLRRILAGAWRFRRVDGYANLSPRERRRWLNFVHRLVEVTETAARVRLSLRTKGRFTDLGFGEQSVRAIADELRRREAVPVGMSDAVLLHVLRHSASVWLALGFEFEPVTGRP